MSNPSTTTNALRLKLTNNANTILKQNNPIPTDVNTINDGPKQDIAKEKLDIRTRIEQKLALRGFKSLNRKNIHSPSLNNLVTQSQKTEKEPGSKSNSNKQNMNVNTISQGYTHTLHYANGRHSSSNNPTNNTNSNTNSNTNTTNNTYYNFNNILKANQNSNRKMNRNSQPCGQDKLQNKQAYTFGKIVAYNNFTQQKDIEVDPSTNRKSLRKYSNSKDKPQDRKQQQPKSTQNKSSLHSINNPVCIKQNNKTYNVIGNNHKRSKSNLSSCSIGKNKSVNKSQKKEENQLAVVPLEQEQNKEKNKSKSKRISLRQRNNIQNSPNSNSTAYNYTCNYNDKEPIFSIYNNTKYTTNKNYNSNTKVDQQTVQTVSNNNNNVNNINSFRSPTKYGYVLPSANSILCESVSKDGNYKVVSRSLAVEQLKQAVQLQYNINMKSKKQSIRQLQEFQNAQSTVQATNNLLTLPESTFQAQNINPSPRNSNFFNQNIKYTLDPSKVSNKQNGNVKAYAVNSNQGISRKYNEDRVSIILNITKNGVKASYFAIYDGHGGSNCCDYLTQNLHQFIFNSKYFPTQPRQALLEGIKIAENKFIQNVKNVYRQKKQLDRSGSCAIILLVVGDDCYVANLGDSRAIMSTCYGKPMYSLSRDHKPTDSGQQTRILKQGGKIYRTEMIKLKKDSSNKKDEQNKGFNNSNQVIIGPLRVYPGKLSVTRTFGDIQAKQTQFGGIKNCISIDPQICKYSLTGKQDFIILGCDGLFEKLDSQQVIEQVWKTIKKNKNNSIHQAVGIAAQSVVKLCMDRKGTDNITTILVCLGSLGLGSNINEYASV